MTNFDFLKNEPKFKDFADVAISAERIFSLIMRHLCLTADGQWNLLSNGCILWTVPLSCHGMTDWLV